MLRDFRHSGENELGQPLIRLAFGEPPSPEGKALQGREFGLPRIMRQAEFFTPSAPAVPPRWSAGLRLPTGRRR